MVEQLFALSKLRGILVRNWDKSIKSFPPCYSQSPLLRILLPPTLEHKWFETGLLCKHCIQKPQVWELSRLYPEPHHICMLMNSASVHTLRKNDCMNLTRNCLCCLQLSCKNRTRLKRKSHESWTFCFSLIISISASNYSYVLHSLLSSIEQIVTILVNNVQIVLFDDITQQERHLPVLLTTCE